MKRTTHSTSKGNVLSFDRDDDDSDPDFDEETGALLTFEQRTLQKRLEVEEGHLLLEQQRFAIELARAADEATERLLQIEMFAGVFKSALPVFLPLLAQFSGGSKEIEEAALAVIANIAQDLPDLKITKEKIERHARDRKAKIRAAVH